MTDPRDLPRLPIHNPPNPAGHEIRVPSPMDVASTVSNARCGSCTSVPPAWELVTPADRFGLPNRFEGRHLLRRARYGNTGRWHDPGGSFSFDVHPHHCHWRTYERAHHDVDLAGPADPILNASPAYEDPDFAGIISAPLWSLVYMAHFDQPGWWVVSGEGGFASPTAWGRCYFVCGLKSGISEEVDDPEIAFTPFRCDQQNVLTFAGGDIGSEASHFSSVTIRPFYK